MIKRASASCTPIQAVKWLHFSDKHNKALVRCRTLYSVTLIASIRYDSPRLHLGTYQFDSNYGNNFALVSHTHMMPLNACTLADWMQLMGEYWITEKLWENFPDDKPRQTVTMDNNNNTTTTSISISYERQHLLLQSIHSILFVPIMCLTNTDCNFWSPIFSAELNHHHSPLQSSNISFNLFIFQSASSRCITWRQTHSVLNTRQRETNTRI